MKKLLLLIVIASVPVFGFAQKKVYAFKPKVSEFAPTSMHEGKSIKIEFRDARIISSKSKVKTTFEDITSAITESLKAAFPKASFVDGNSDITIILKLEQYEVFARGVVWIGITKYQVGLKHGSDEIQQEIDGTHSEGNVLGMGTAKSVQQKSFNEANNILVKLLVDAM